MRINRMSALGLLGQLLCLSILLNGNLGYAQDRNCTVSHYTTENGLPQNSVKDIKFDRAGYCWLATEMGLVRFDGKVFKSYGTSQIKGLLSDRIQYMNIENDPLIPVKPVGSLYAYSSEGQILSIDASGQNSPIPKLENSKFIRTSYEGRVIKDKKIITTIDSLNGKDENAYKKWVCGMGGDQAYFFDDKRLYYLKNGKTKLISTKNQSSYQSMFLMAPFLGKYLIRIFPKNEVQLWMDGILQNKYRKIFGELDSSSDYQAGRFSLLHCEAGTYIYCQNNLYEINIANGQLVCKLVLKNINIPNVTSLYFSPVQNRFYFGSGTDGLYVVQINSFQYPDLPTDDSGPFTNVPSFYAQAKINDSLIFSKDIVLPLNGKPSILKLGGGNISAAIYNDKGALYYQSDKDLRRYDWKTKKVTNLHKLDSDLRSIFYDSVSKSIIFFTEYRFGKINNRSFTTTIAYPGAIRVSNAVPNGQNEFLLATHSGLKWYNSKTNKIIRSVLDSAVIRAVHKDSSQRMWISTYGKGFYLQQDGVCHLMPTGPREALRTVHSFIEDRRGNFWLPTNNGLYLASKSSLIAYSTGKIKDVYFYLFDIKNGLKTNEFNGGCSPSYLWMKDSLLSLPSINGLVWFYPNQLKPLDRQNRIFLDQVVINNQDTVIKNNKITLPANFEMISLLVSSPYFGIHENMQLEYSLKRNSKTWLPLPENGEIVLRDISPGYYNIVVRKRAQYMDGNGQELRIQMVILPKFYNTWWFYLIIILIVILTTFWISRQRIKNLTEISRMLQLQVDIRTTKLSQAVHELKVSEQELLKSNQIKDKMMTMILHDLRSPIRFISFLSGHLLSNYPELTPEEMAENLLDLNKGAVGLNEFTERFFKWAILQQQDFRIRETVFPIQEIFNEIRHLYLNVVKTNGNKLVILPTKESCYTDQQILSFIIRNLIDNANKNTYQGEISLSVTTNLTSITIQVSDNGKGMTESEIKRFFDRNRNYGTDRIGSVLVQQMLEKIGGKIEISSVPGEGTQISIILANLRQHDTPFLAAKDPLEF